MNTGAGAITWALCITGLFLVVIMLLQKDVRAILRALRSRLETEASDRELDRRRHELEIAERQQALNERQQTAVLTAGTLEAETAARNAELQLRAARAREAAAMLEATRDARVREELEVVAARTAARVAAIQADPNAESGSRDEQLGLLLQAYNAYNEARVALGNGPTAFVRWLLGKEQERKGNLEEPLELAHYTVPELTVLVQGYVAYLNASRSIGNMPNIWATWLRA